MTINPIRDLRDRLNLTRDEFGERVGMSASTIAKYDSDPLPELHRKLAQIASEAGHEDGGPLRYRFDSTNRSTI